MEVGDVLALPPSTLAGNRPLIRPQLVAELDSARDPAQVVPDPPPGAFCPACVVTLASLAIQQVEIADLEVRRKKTSAARGNFCSG